MQRQDTQSKGKGAAHLDDVEEVGVGDALLTGQGGLQGADGARARDGLQGVNLRVGHEYAGTHCTTDCSTAYQGINLRVGHQYVDKATAIFSSRSFSVVDPGTKHGSEVRGPRLATCLGQVHQHDTASGDIPAALPYIAASNWPSERNHGGEVQSDSARRSAAVAATFSQTCMEPIQRR